MTHDERVKMIKEILKKDSHLITCPHCGRSYIPMAHSATEECPICERSLNYDVTVIADKGGDNFEELESCELDEIESLEMIDLDDLYL